MSIVTVLMDYFNFQFFLGFCIVLNWDPTIVRERIGDYSPYSRESLRGTGMQLTIETPS
jgi:hypothetical protein